MVSQGKRGKRFFLRLLLSSFRSNCLNRPFTARTTPPSKYTFRRIYTQTWPCSAPLDAARFRFSPHRLVPKTLDVDGPLVVVLAPAVLPLYWIMRMKERERDERCGDPETRVIRINAAECFFANTFPLPRFGGIGKLTRCLIYIPEYRTKNRSGGFCYRYHFSSRKRRARSSPLDPSKILGDCRDYSFQLTRNDDFWGDPSIAIPGKSTSNECAIVYAILGEKTMRRGESIFLFRIKIRL